MTELNLRQLNITDAARYLETSRASIYRRLDEGLLVRDAMTGHIDIAQLQALRYPALKQSGLAQEVQLEERPILHGARELGRGVLTLLGY